MFLVSDTGGRLGRNILSVRMGNGRSELNDAAFFWFCSLFPLRTLMFLKPKKTLLSTPILGLLLFLLRKLETIVRIKTITLKFTDDFFKSCVVFPRFINILESGQHARFLST